MPLQRRPRTRVTGRSPPRPIGRERFAKIEDWMLVRRDLAWMKGPIRSSSRGGDHEQADRGRAHRSGICARRSTSRGRILRPFLLRAVRLARHGLRVECEPECRIDPGHEPR